MWKSWKRSCSWMAPHTWTSSLPTPLMMNLQGYPPGLGTKRPSRIWVENKNTHECKHIHSHGHLRAHVYYAIFSICSSVRSTACLFLYIPQVELCWIHPSMARLVTLTPWSTRSVTVLAFTTCFGAYRRWNHATTRVWRLSPRWKLEICVQTQTPLPNTKAATIPIQAMKPAGAGTSRIRPSTTTWVMLVSYKPKDHTLTFISGFSLNHFCRLQMTPARTPSPWTRWQGCTVTWTSSTRPGSQHPNPLWYRCRRKWSNSITIPSPWSGFIPSRDTFTTGEMSCICLREWIRRNLQHLVAPWNVVQPMWYAFGLYLSCLLCLSVGFLEKWDQCVINALRGGFCSSMPPTPPPPDPATPLDTGPLERLKVRYQTYLFL